MGLTTKHMFTIVLLIVLTALTIILIIIEAKRYSLMKSTQNKEKTEKKESKEEKRTIWGPSEMRIRPAPLLTELIASSNQKQQPQLNVLEIQKQPTICKEEGQIVIPLFLGRETPPKVEEETSAPKPQIQELESEK